MTIFFFLNDVKEGGETVLFGTDMDGSFPGRSESVEAWHRLRLTPSLGRRVGSHRVSVSICSQLPELLWSNALAILICLGRFASKNWTYANAYAQVVKPRMGTALMWYNAAVDSEGWSKQSAKGEGCFSERSILELE